MSRNWRTATYVLLSLTSLLTALGTEDVEGWRWALLVVGLAVALAGIWWRTSRPWLFVIGGLAAALAGEPLILSLALFSLALRRRDAWLIAAALAGSAAIAVSPSTLTLTYEDGTVLQPGDPQFQLAALLMRGAVAVVFVVVPLLLGAYLGSRREVLAGLTARAEAAEAEREARAEAAVLAERSRIAGEMHDSLGHRLVLIATQAGGLELNSARGADFVEDHARIIGETAREALAELRATVGALSAPTRAPAPGVADIGRLVDEARQAGAELSATLKPLGPLAPRVDAALYRLAQEGLTNALKHAPGRPVTLTLAALDGEARLTITNPLGPGAPGNGTGLTRLRERVDSLGGTLIAGDDGAVFTLAARLPLDRVAA